MPLKILHVGKYFPPFAGGMEHFLADLALAQAQQHSVTVLAHHHIWHWPTHTLPSQPENYASIQLYRAPSYGRLLYAPVSPHYPLWLKQIIKRHSPQILHLHLPNTSAFWALGQKTAQSMPWIIHWHSDVTSQINRRLTLAYPFYRPFEQRLLAKAAAILVTSPPYLHTSSALQPWRSKCHTIPLGLDPQRLPLPNSQIIDWSQQQWLPRLTRFLCIGRLTYYKGHRLLLQALTQVPNAQLLIVGQGELQSQLNHLIKQWKLTSRVKLLGHLPTPHLHGLLCTCDAFCLPSLERTEAFGIVLLEAMRYGKPIIVSDIPGSGTAWVTGEGSLKVPPGELSSLIEALQTMARNDSLREHLGQKGQQRFFQAFTLQAVVQQISQVYEGVLKHS